jgi:hypothetical protein
MRKTSSGHIFQENKMRKIIIASVISGFFGFSYTPPVYSQTSLSPETKNYEEFIYRLKKNVKNWLGDGSSIISSDFDLVNTNSVTHPVVGRYQIIADNGKSAVFEYELDFVVDKYIHVLFVGGRSRFKTYGGDYGPWNDLTDLNRWQAVFAG